MATQWINVNFALKNRFRRKIGNVKKNTLSWWRRLVATTENWRLCAACFQRAQPRSRSNGELGCWRGLKRSRWGRRSKEGFYHIAPGYSNNSDTRRSRYACIIEAHESTRTRMGKPKPESMRVLLQNRVRLVDALQLGEQPDTHTPCLENSGCVSRS